MVKLEQSKIILAIAAVGVLSACAKPEEAKVAAPDPGKAAEAIKANMADLVSAFNARDVEKAVSFDAPKYVGMFHGAPNVDGPDEDRALTKQQMADMNAKVAASNETVDVASAGDMAVYRANYAYTFTDPKTKKPTTEVGNWVVGFRRQPDGTWKITFTVVSDLPPTALPPTTPASQPKAG